MNEKNNVVFTQFFLTFIVEGNVNPGDVHFAGGFVELVHENCFDQGLSAGQGVS